MKKKKLENIIQKVSISQYLGLFCFFYIIIIFGLGFWNLSLIEKSNDGFKEIYEVRIKALENVKKIQKILLFDIIGIYQNSLTDLEELGDNQLELEKTYGSLEALIGDLDLFLSKYGSKKEKNLHLKFMNGFERHQNDFIERVKPLFFDENKEKLAQFINYELKIMITNLEKSLVEIQSIQENSIENLYLESGVYYKNQKNLITTVSIGVSIIAIIVAYLILLAINSSIQLVSTQLSEIATGKTDLSKKLNVKENRNDALSVLYRSFNSLLDELKNVLSGVKKTQGKVEVSSEKITVGSDKIQSLTLELGDLSKDLSSTSSEIISTSESVTVSMKDISKRASKTADFAEQGRESLSELEKTMGEMETAYTTITSVLQNVSDKVSNITNIVITITKIADQTNLLSLNASIEAEKAGEFGAGFSVVAREIRRLADQVANATLEIDSMVFEMDSTVSMSVEKITDFFQSTQGDMKNIRNVGIQFHQIIQQVQQLLPKIEQIHKVIENQSSKVGKISSSVSHLTSFSSSVDNELHSNSLVIKKLRDSSSELNLKIEGFQLKEEKTPSRIKEPV